MSKTVLCDLPIADLVRTRGNPRTEMGADWEELKASIAAVGVRVPVHVAKDGKGKYRLMAGNRRLTASKAAGLTTIPAIVHEGLNAAAQYEMTVIENALRADLTLFEGVDAVVKLMGHHSGDVRAVASLLGWTEQAVRLRANIASSLIPKWRKTVADRDTCVSSWTAGHLALIARLPEEAQEASLERWQYHGQASSMSVAVLERSLAEQTREMATAPWDLKKPMGDLRPCDGCLRRSGASPLLWGEVEQDEAGKDKCLDPDCWLGKSVAFLRDRFRELKAEGGRVVPYIPKSVEVPYWQREAIEEALGAKVAHSWAISPAKKGAAGAVRAMAIAGKGMGAIRWMTLRNEYEESEPAKQGGPTPLKERRKQLERRRWARVVETMREGVAKAAFGDLAHPQPALAVMKLAAVIGTPYDAYSVGKDLNAEDLIKWWGSKPWTDLETLCREMDKNAAAVWPKVRTEFLRAWLSKPQSPGKTTDAQVGSAGVAGLMLDIDVQALFEEASKQKGLTVPKSWAGLNENGTKKTPAKKKAKKKAKKGDKA